MGAGAATPTRCKSNTASASLRTARQALTPQRGGGHASNTSATTLSVGYTAPILDFNVSARTGYSATASIGFGETARLCGVDNTPPNNPEILVAS
jgi:hypothetical protein